MPDPHVLVVIDSLEPNGAESYAVRLANALAARGMPVTLASGKAAAAASGETLAGEVGPGVRRLALPWRWHRSKAVQVRSLWASVGVLERAVQQGGIGVVQTLLPTTMIAGWAAARRGGAAVVHTQMHVSGVAGRADRAASRLLLPRLDAVVALGTFLRNDIMQAFGTRPERTVLCRLGVDVDHFTPAGRAAARAALAIPDGVPAVGICTSLRPIKDPMLALRAFAALRARRPACFVVVGDGEMRAEMEAFVAAHGLTADVRFLGHRADVREAVPAFDVYLETCHGPNLGLAPLETLAMGVPLLVATRDATEEAMARDTLVDGSAGTLAPADPEALGAALDAFFDCPAAEVTRMAAAARATALAHYRWSAHVDALAGHYRRLAQMPRHRRGDLV